VEQIFQIQGMHCGACVGRVQAALAPLASSATVSLNPPQALLQGLTASADAVLAAVASAGKYTAVATLAPPPTVVLTQSWWSTYRPLLILAAFLFCVPLLAQTGQGQIDWAAWMRHFMAGFFLSFAFFKLLDVVGFARAYQGYDLLAKAWPTWGYIYPFVELALGVAYLLNWQPKLTNAVTVAVMGVSILGVIIALRRKQRIQCACLGAVFNLPMSTVTLVEDGLMIVMAATMWFMI
jgi:copper chaperone CopZ